MAGYSSRRDQLWYFALKLAEEETKFIQIAQQEEEHGRIIQSKYNQLVSSLSCLGDIIAMMYQKKKLTLKELEQIQHLQSTPIRANEELLSIIVRKPRDVYECFLSLIKHTNQLHLYHMLVSGDDSCDKANREDVSDHKDLICRNFIWLSDNLETESGLISMLYQENVLTVREKERIFCVNDTFQKNELLLGLLSKKSPKDFEKFLDALDDLGQNHLTEKLRKPEGSPLDRATEPYAVQTPEFICKESLQNADHKSEQKPIPLRSSSEPNPLTKIVHTRGQNRVVSRSLSKPAPPPKPGNQSAAAQHDAKSMQIVNKHTEKRVCFRKSDGVKVQTRLEELETQLQTEIALKGASVCLFHLDKPKGSLKMCFDIILQECHRMNKETIARKVEANVELEQLRENASTYSAAESLNEVFRTQLLSMQHELTSERFQSNKERMQLVEKINKLKADIHNEKAKCKRFEEDKLLHNTVIMKLEDRSKKLECDKQFLQQQVYELNARLATCEYELHKSKETFEESNSEMILLRTERDKLEEVCEILSKEKEFRKELEIQLHHAQENIRDLLGRLKEKEESLQVAEKEKLDLNKTRESTLEEKSLQSAQILILQEELETKKHQRKELEDQLSYATAQLELLYRQLEDIKFIPVSQEIHVIRSNHQFLVANIKSSRLIDLLYEKNCITNEERDHLSNQPGSFYRNDALLHWMRTIALKQDKGLKVLECFHQAEQNFVVGLLEKGGVLIKSKISTKLVKERQSFSLFAKSTSENVEALKEKEVAVIERLNQAQRLSLSSRQNATSEIADDDIVIVPFCHQEDNGIVIWFWCQSKNAQRNLHSMYSSGILLGKLVTIFKKFSNVGVSSPSEVLVPTSITIFVDDFTKDEKVIDFQSDPKLLLTIKTKETEKIYSAIYALAVLADEIFVITGHTSEVEVYNRTILQFQRSFRVDKLEEPRDIVSCSRNNCLYIIDGKPMGQPMEILRVDITGNVLKKLWRGNDWGRLSVTYESNLILAVLDKSKLLEITSDGKLVREITLAVSSPWHAVKLTNDRFVVGYRRSKSGGICMVNEKGKVLMSPGLKALNTSKFLPINVAVNKDGSLLLVDEDGGRIILLTSTLDYQREFISRKDGLKNPRRIVVDELNGRLLACDNLVDGGCILVFDIAG